MCVLTRLSPRRDQSVTSSVSSRADCHPARSLKWKPPSENSIDFLLQLKFPSRADRPDEPDFTAKPCFMLMMNHGHEGTHYYDTMEVDDETWAG